MSQVSASELAGLLNVSKARVSQYVSQGKLAGCFSGDGRLRRFDLAACKKALGRALDKGQMLGNGAETRKALSELKVPSDFLPSPEAAKPETGRRQDGLLGDKDPDRYDLARTQKAEEEVRILRRRNAEADGKYVLAEEVQRQVARLMAQEISEIEAVVIRDGARKVADVMGVDFKTVRQIMTEAWRQHRAGRSAQLEQQAKAMTLTPEEQAEDI